MDKRTRMLQLEMWLEKKKEKDMPTRLVSVIFVISDAERYSVDSNDDEAVIELLRKKLDKQPFSWELAQYSLDEDIGTEE